MFIEDATSGKRAGVNSENQLSVRAYAEPYETLRGMDDGRVWSVVIDAVDPTAADDLFVYLKNDSSTEDLVVTSIDIGTTVTGALKLVGVTGTASGGTAQTPQSLRIASSAVAPVTAQTGVDITGLTETLKHAYILPANDGRSVLHKPVVISNAQAIALRWVAATGILSGTITFYMRTINT